MLVLVTDEPAVREAPCAQYISLPLEGDRAGVAVDLQRQHEVPALGELHIGHVVRSVLQCVMSVVLVGAVAVAIGFRPTDATALEGLAAFGLLALFALALTWIAVGMARPARTPRWQATVQCR
ncbi:hypothetical protein GCM10010207_51450 [Streptomyces atratus]|nr:hypothetical protein GCM10010207_51450 [Streptomyces atratus]